MTRLIDADSVYKWYLEAFKGQIKPNEIRFSMNDIRENLENIPTVDAEPVRHGKWIFNPIDAVEAMFAKPKCSVCGFESADGGNYCHNCGARMDETQKKPCGDCQQFDCYGCEYAERKEDD